jgi:hypothetical protein
MGEIGPAMVAVIAGIIGLAIVAVIVGKSAQTPQVLQAGGSALSAVIGAAVSPVSGNAGGVFGTNAPLGQTV